MPLPPGAEPPKIPKAKIDEIIVAAGLPSSGPEYEAYVAYVEAASAEVATQLAGSTYDALIATLQQRPPQAVLDSIVARQLTEAADLTTNMVATQLEVLGSQLSEATALGQGPLDVARALDTVRGLDAPRAKAYLNRVKKLEESGLTDAEVKSRADIYFKKLLKSRKETIARTEMRNGTSGVQRSIADQRGAKFKVWQTVGDNRVSDECQANEAEGPIPINQEFSGGVQHPSQHPDDRCTVSYFTNPDLKDVYKSRSDARAERTKAAKKVVDVAT